MLRSSVLAKCTPMGRISLARGLVSTVSSLLSSSPTTPLFGALFAVLQAESNAVSSYVRSYALNALELWGSAVGDMKSLAEMTSTETDVKECLAPLLEIIHVNWEHPYRQVFFVVKELYAHYVRLAQKVFFSLLSFYLLMLHTTPTGQAPV